jgi:hypothetical protein
LQPFHIYNIFIKNIILTRGLKKIKPTINFRLLKLRNKKIEKLKKKYKNNKNFKNHYNIFYKVLRKFLNFLKVYNLREKKIEKLKKKYRKKKRKLSVVFVSAANKAHNGCRAKKSRRL